MEISGIPVVDAHSKITIKITASDVEKGATKDPGACAAARACIRDLHAKAARVHLGRTYVKIAKDGKDRWVRFHTPQALRAEIIAFDRGGHLRRENTHWHLCSPHTKQLGKGRAATCRQRSAAKLRVHTILSLM